MYVHVHVVFLGFSINRRNKTVDKQTQISTSAKSSQLAQLCNKFKYALYLFCILYFSLTVCIVYAHT